MAILPKYWIEGPLMLGVFATFVVIAAATGELDGRMWVTLVASLPALLGVLGYFVFMQEKGGPAIAGPSTGSCTGWPAGKTSAGQRWPGAASAPPPGERQSVLPPLKLFAPITWAVVFAASGGVGAIMGAGAWVWVLAAVIATGCVISLLIAARLEKRASA